MGLQHLAGMRREPEATEPVADEPGTPQPCCGTAAAGAAPAVGIAAVNEDDENVIRLLLRASENKIRRMSPDMRKLKIKEYLLKGYIEN